MNKFEKKLSEIVNDNSSVLELQAMKDTSELEKWIDTIFNFAFSLTDAFKQLKNMKGHYLESYNNTHTLIIIDKSLNVEKHDVTKLINNSHNQNSFVFEGTKYKFFKILK